MKIIPIQVNGQTRRIKAPPGMPLLWVLREQLMLTGTKYGCGAGQCGACTVLVKGQAVRSCITPAASIGRAPVLTIEGMGAHPMKHVQKAWDELDVPQCGYCQSGQIMSAVALLTEHPSPTEAQIDEAMRGNICRCGSYAEIRAAIRAAAAVLQGKA
ncbi:(2Fe-2S)-binding protein [Aquabacterium sp.]|uniref:(2Fe-2S)-binding protein n=1 Tax=Aquabacterium sp. TaxID=1872578 RepID=UPI003D6C893F